MLEDRDTVGGSIVVDQGAAPQGRRGGTGTLPVNGSLRQKAGSTLLANGGQVAVMGHAPVVDGVGRNS
ncbi:hypothetical protein [Komagataeibacter sp. FNDCF1]|uniref:hypothetical protein n=1 Tax=Komagataeibacter sp. FNDCF1 TaxID=2878681 RepID=UPI001E3DBD36|nr:hypothetical protein [Komagataeibacter sp. FNDCF1]MCE2565198.1 hypothetical protein [Komagataeibacter sp. FNDCF1]